METKPIFIQCDSCKSLMDAKEITMNTEKMLGISVDYFRCTSCGWPYVYKLTDKHQKVLDNQIIGLSEVIKIKKRHGKSVSPAKSRRIQQLRTESHDYQQLLKNNYLKAVTEQLKQSGVVETSSITGKEDES